MFRYLTYLSFSLLSVSSFAQGSISKEGSHQVQANEENPHNKASAADILSGLNKVQQTPSVVLKPVFTGSAELGYLYKTGNSNSGDIKSGVDLHFENGQWLSLLNIDLLVKKADVKDENGDIHFETIDKKWGFTSQTNYSLQSGEKNYIYGNIWYEDSEFNSFVNQSSISAGWGRHWFKSSSASLWADIGPGYKRDLFKETDNEPQRSADSWIIQVQALYIRKLGDHVEFKQVFSAKHALRASDNSIYKAESTITTKLISTLQLKFTFKVDYNTEVEENRENMDSQTAVTLVYSF